MNRVNIEEDAQKARMLNLHSGQDETYSFLWNLRECIKNPFHFAHHVKFVKPKTFPGPVQYSSLPDFLKQIKFPSNGNTN